IEVDRELGRAPRGRLLFSNPDHAGARQRITIKASDDGGRTWPADRTVLLDSGRSAGYSCLTVIDEATVGILYESSQAHLAFQRVPLADLLPMRGAFRFGRGIGARMVVQADRPFTAHGTGMPGMRVECEFGDTRRETTVGDDGRWRAEFPARKASFEPLHLRARSGDETLLANDILVGEVWICAGQSNMEWPVRRAALAAEALAEPISDTIRLLDARPGAWTHPAPYGAPEVERLAPTRYFEGAWRRADRESVAEVSAVGWWFARRLSAALGVPVGLVDLAVGGSPTEAWIPDDALASSAEWRPLVEGRWTANARLTDFCRRRGGENLAALLASGVAIPGDATGPNHPFKPGFLWSAGLEPLLPVAVRGILWYQGESNAESPDRALEHRALMATLVDAWRARLDDAGVPFLVVQLPAMDRPAWPAFRESQRRLLGDRDGIAMAVAIDTGLRTDVHPPLKRPVGERLAELALARTYGRGDLPVAYGPTLLRADSRDGAIELSFECAGRGLATTDGTPVRHLEVAGDDGLWHAATGTIVGTSTLRVASPEVPAPRAARYAWVPFPEPAANLADTDGRPASPFTTAP
ncbi:MAG: Acetylxylan esterase precursor, partial [Planctomycetota bacterium]